MDPIQELIDRINAFERSVNQFVLDRVQENEAEVIRLNVDEQLFEGINADGQEIRPPYTEGYERFKRQRGLRSDRVTLRLTGEFHASWLVIYGPDAFQLDADDRKKVWLERKYTRKIYGLTPANLVRFIDHIRPDFITTAQNQLFG